MQNQFDAISSSVRIVKFPENVYLDSPGTPQPGDLIAVRVRNVNPKYSYLELTDGTKIQLRNGMLVVGAAGSRWALRGFTGILPGQLKIGDHVNVLNLGGVIGVATDYSPDLGPATTAGFMGFLTHNGKKLNLLDFAPEVAEADSIPQVIAVIGTCMNVGKTTAVSTLVKQFTKYGMKVAAGKLSGVAAIKDGIDYQKHGAIAVSTFSDFGWASSADIPDIASVAKKIVNHLAVQYPDLIVLELGDGIMGKYGVSSLLSDHGFASMINCWVLCAADPAAAFGALKYTEPYGITPSVIAGPVSDNLAGITAVAEFSDIPVISAFKNPAGIYAVVKNSLAGQIVLEGI